MAGKQLAQGWERVDIAVIQQTITQAAELAGVNGQQSRRRAKLPLSHNSVASGVRFGSGFAVTISRRRGSAQRR